MTCPGCGQRPGQAGIELCEKCADNIGVIAMPPPRRPPAPCGRCNGLVFVRAIPREHSTTGGDTSSQVTAPMYVTYRPQAHEGWLFRYVKDLDIKHRGAGLFEIYICRGCGLVEWYCHDVERIPLHPQLMTELVDYGGDTPYRG